ncbi:MAG: YceD family protein [Pseudomonadota bacterium]
MSAIDVTAADVRKLAQQRVRVELSEPVSRLLRLSAALVADAESQDPASIAADSEKEAPRAQPPRASADLGRFAAVLQFAQDSQGRATVRGQLALAVTMACHRCLEARTLPLDQALDLTLLDERGFDRLNADEQAQLDLAIVDLKAADLLALIEDELLLALPTQVCSDDDCERLPAMSFAPAEAQNTRRESVGKRAKEHSVKADHGTADHGTAGQGKTAAEGQSFKENEAANTGSVSGEPGRGRSTLSGERQHPFADLRSLLEEQAQSRQPQNSELQKD